MAAVEEKVDTAMICEEVSDQFHSAGGHSVVVVVVLLLLEVELTLTDIHSTTFLNSQNIFTISVVINLYGTGICRESCFCFSTPYVSKETVKELNNHLRDDLVSTGQLMGWCCCCCCPLLRGDEVAE